MIDMKQISNFSKHCRTCLKVCQEEAYNVDAMPAPIFHLFKQSVSYKRSQKNFPNHLCALCYETLKSFEEFRSTALRSTHLLEQAFRIRDNASESKEAQHKVAEAVTEQSDSASNEQPEQVLDFVEVDTYLEQHNFSSGHVSSVANRTTSPSLKGEAVRKYHDSESNDVSDQVQEFEEIFIKAGEHDNELFVCRPRDSFSETAKSEEKYYAKKPLYTCPHCSRSFRYPKPLSKHLTQAHHIKPTFPVCPDKNCNKAFPHDETTMQHYRLDHEMTVKRRVKPNDASCICEDCGRIFKNVHKLKEHRYQHEPIESRPFHCEQCGKRFISKRSYNEHLLRHAGIKAFECPYCEMKKTSARELRAHMNVHTKEKQYQCPLCSRVFHRAANLNIHDRVVHKRIRRFNCRYCDQSFGKPDTRKYHEMRHSGEKPHKCSVCEKSFIQPTALKTHMKIHNKKEKTISPK